MDPLFENWRKYLLNERYSIKDSLEALKPTNKKMRRVYKRYANKDWHWELERGWVDPQEEPEPDVPEEKINKAWANYREYIFEIIPEDIWGQNATTPEQKKKEADKNQGLAIMWIRKLSIENPKIARDIIDGDVSYAGRDDLPGGYSNIMPNLEIYFQNLDLMPKKNLIELESFEELHQMVEEAKEEIRTRQQGKQYMDAEAGIEILSGKMERSEETGRLERKPGKNGWFVAIVHNKGAACELGKETDWCTAAPGLDYFEDYYEPNDPLFFFEGFWTEPSTRFQFHYGSESFMDKDDAPVDARTFKTLHNLLMQTEAPGNYQVVQNKQYDMIAGDSDTPAEVLADIIDYHMHDADLPSSVMEKVAKNAKTPLEALKKLYRSTHDKYIIRNIQVNPVIDFALAKEIFVSHPKDELIYHRGRKQLLKFAEWKEISFQEAQRLLDAANEARNYEAPRMPPELASAMRESVATTNIMENWQLFKENKGPGDFLYDITTSSTEIYIKLLDSVTKKPAESKKEDTSAYIKLEKRIDVPHWEVAWSSSPADSEKVGTVMYLMALELADEGVSPDSYETSPDALRVWNKFMKKNELGVKKSPKPGHEGKSEDDPFNFVFFKPKKDILNKYSENITDIHAKTEEEPEFDEFYPEPDTSSSSMEDILASYEEGDFF